MRQKIKVVESDFFNKQKKSYSFLLEESERLTSKVESLKKAMIDNHRKGNDLSKIIIDNEEEYKKKMNRNSAAFLYLGITIGFLGTVVFWLMK